MSKTQASKQVDSSQEKVGRIEYALTAFVLREPHKSSNVAGPYRLRNREEHRALVDDAKRKKLQVWMVSIKEDRGRVVTVGPYLIDWDSVPEPSDGVNSGQQDQRHALVCPKCGKVCSSTSGLTLHRNRCAS